MSEQTSPTWAEQLITALQALWPVDRPLELVMADDDHLVWTLHNGVADGACNIRPGGITLYLRSHAQDTEYWRDVLIHEYVHAVMGALLESIASDVPVGIAAYQGNAYVQRMEAVTTRIAGLLEYAIRTGAIVRAT